MKTYHIVLLLAYWCLSIINQVISQTPNFVWAKQFGGFDHEIGRALAVDADGNVYTTGEFFSTADFNPSDDPNTGTYNMTPVGYQDVFISKLDANGNFLWAKQFGGSGTDRPHAIILDSNGNIYITGIFFGTADFDPGPGTFNLTSAGYEDAFIAKFDVSGNLIWAKRMGGTGTDISYAIAVNAIGNISITGIFRNTADFDPGPGVYNLTAVYRDIFVATLDASGNFLWAKRMGGGWNANGNTGSSGNAIAVDAAGNVYTTGYFSNTGDFDPGVEVYNMSSPNHTDIFVSKLDPSGNFVWAKQIGGERSGGDVSNAIAIDAVGNVYITGFFTNTADFNPSPFGTYNLTSFSSSDAFVAKLDTNGEFIWAKQIGGIFSEEGVSIALDDQANVYTTGHFWGTTDFDPDDNQTQILTSAGEEDIFVSKLDQYGNYVWAARMGGRLEDIGRAIVVDADENVYTTGNFFSTSADFDPGNGTYELSPVYNGGYYIYSDVFVEKLCQLAPPTITMLGSTTFCEGDSVILTTSPADSYLWSNGATFQSISVKNSGNYAVTISSAGGCSAASSTITVIVNQQPTTPEITAGGPTTFCEGGSVQLTASLGASYLWSNGATTQDINVASSGSYSVTVTNGAGCSAASSATTVTVNPSPSATIAAGGPTSFCEGGSVQLTANNGASYLWSNGATTQSIEAASSKSYSVTVTNGAGCSAASSATTVTVNPSPSATIAAGGPTTFCEGGSVQLTASNGASYLWSNGATTQSIEASLSGSYSVTVTNGAGCSAASSATTVTVNPSPSATIAAGGPTSFCEGGSVQLTANNGASYLWSNGATTQSIEASSSGSYLVTVTDGAGCSAASSATTVTVNPSPSATITADGPTSFCEGGAVQLTASNGASYLWSNGVTTQSIEAASSGSYSVTVTNGAGCSAVSEEKTVTVNPSPVAAITAGGPTTFCEGGSVQLTASNGASYQWSSGATTHGINVTSSGNYSVTVTNAVGCSAASLETNITVSQLPSVDFGADTITLQPGEQLAPTVEGQELTYHWSNDASTPAIGIDLAGTYAVTVTNEAGCVASDAVVVEIMTVSTKELEGKYKIEIFPNPTDDAINIVCEGLSTSSVQLLNSQGMVIAQYNSFVSAGARRTLSLKQAPSGIYYVRIMSRKYVKTIPVLKR